MAMIPREYIIDTSRSDKELSKVTISGFNKANVLTKLIERLRLHDVSGSNHWAAELNASNHTELAFNKLASYAANEINMQNVRWPVHFYKLIAKIGKAGMQSGRNNQTVRNALAEVTTILALSGKKPFKVPKIGELDFEMEYIQSKLVAKNNSLAKQIMRNEDPKDLILPINELGSQIVLSRQALNGKNSHMMGLDTPVTDPYYWLAWFIEWDKHMSSKKVNDGGYLGAHRGSDHYDSKFAKDTIWIVWDLLLGLADRFQGSVDSIADNVYALYRMYTFNFSKARKNERKFLLFNAVQYLVTDIDWNKSVFVERIKVLQLVAGVNLTYERIGSGAREWENSIRPSSIARYIENGNSKTKAIASENAYENELREEVDMLLSTPAVLGLPAPRCEEEPSKPPLIREFESRKESYDPLIKRPERAERAINHFPQTGTSQTATRAAVRQAPTRNLKPGLDMPVACTGGAGCFFTSNFVKVDREPLADDEMDQIKEVLIGLDQNTQHKEEKSTYDMDDE